MLTSKVMVYHSRKFTPAAYVIYKGTKTCTRWASPLTAAMPVATVAIGNAGAKNAAVLAAQILALLDVKLAEKLAEFKKKQAAKVLEKDSGVG